MNFSTELTLDKLRQELVRQEDTIIFGLIERAQFSMNPEIYQPGYFKEIPQSFLEHFLHDIECVHAKVRRYTSPDEYPFTGNLPEPILPPLEFPEILVKNDINYNSKILDMYRDHIVPKLCKSGSDGNHGSSATKDVECLQALSRRIHMGKFVAEAKFTGHEHEQYVALIKNKDRQGLMDLLTNAQVEERLLKRVRNKALIYGQEIGDAPIPDSQRIPAEMVVKLYQEFVIPMTKEVEVDYLLVRLDADS
ncbi:chorismate mutase [Gorgonomyces haynaldii]|nr:chorismate mutase [Gorgonomyces haynaldii]